ncbi:unnamed protein product, partial [Didymodactylos carnosus]
MSNEAIHIIENVKKKLQKYSETNQDDKVQEYLTKLQHVGVTIDLLKITHVDYVVKRLCSQNNNVYSETARNLLTKWISESKKNGHSMNGKLNTNKSTKKRKSNEDILNEANESQSPHSCATANKQRKVLSVNEYLSKRSSTVLTTPPDSYPYKNDQLTAELMNDNLQYNNTNLTDIQIEELRDSFNKTTDLLASNAPKLNYIRDDNNNERRQPALFTKGLSKSNLTVMDSQQNENHRTSADKFKDLWAQASDDDEEDTPEQQQTMMLKKSVVNNYSGQKTNKQSAATSSTSSKIKNKSKHTVGQCKKVSETTKTELFSKKTVQSPTKNSVEKQKKQDKISSTSEKTQSEHSRQQQAITAIVRSSPPPASRPVTTSSSQSTVTKPAAVNNTSLQYLSSRRERPQMYSGKRTIRDYIPKLENLCLDTLKEHIDVISHRYFNLLPYELLQPVIELATSDQLKNIVYNNQNYADDIEPLWQRFCQLEFKEAVPDENESYFELYWRKREEKEDLFREVTSKLSQKFAQKDNTA